MLGKGIAYVTGVNKKNGQPIAFHIRNTIPYAVIETAFTNVLVEKIRMNSRVRRKEYLDAKANVYKACLYTQDLKNLPEIVDKKRHELSLYKASFKVFVEEHSHAGDRKE